MPSVTHLVATDNFAGVERYISTIAGPTRERGWSVRVLGGDHRVMRRVLPEDVEWRPAASLRGAVRALRQERPSDVLHVHMTNAEVAAALAGRRSAIVATRHFAAPRGSSPLARAVGRWAARSIAGEIAISETVRRTSGEPGMTVLLNAVPDNSRPRLPERTVVVAQRLEHEKRTADAVAAFVASGLADDGWRLLVYGEGSLRGPLQAQVDASGRAGHIELRGRSDVMDDVLSRAGIVLATAAHEPFGLLVAEAMAAGAPVVASAAGGHLETVGRVEQASLFTPGDVDGAARVLRELAARPTAAREDYGHRLQAWQRDHLSLPGHLDALLAVYAQARRARRTGARR